MIAKTFINHSLQALNLNDNVAHCLEIFNDYAVADMPIVEESFVIAYVLKSDIEFEAIETTLGSFFNLGKPLIINDKLPFFEILKKISEFKTDTLAVVNDQNEYLGIIRKSDIYDRFFESIKINENGTTIEIKLNETNYSISDISRIIEQEHAQILSIFRIENIEDSSFSLVINLETTQLHFIVQALERYDYDVVSYFAHERVYSQEKDRYDLLMKYLSI